MRLIRKITSRYYCSFTIDKGRLGACVILFTILCSLSSAAQVSATFKGDSTQIEIGDKLNMKLVVNVRPGYMVDFPQFTGDSIGPNIEIVKKDKVDKVALGNDTIYSQNITISAYEEGRYFINPLKIYYKNISTGVIDSVFTNDFQLVVTTVQVDTTKPIKPIKAPLKVDYKLYEFTWWIVGLVLSLIAAIVGFILYRKYKNKPAPAVARPRPKEPAHIWANKELQKLDSEKLWQNDNVKLYHSRLTDILRLYLEYRFGYYAMEATSEEIMTEVYKYDVNMDAGSKLREILTLADFVKFAKMNPAPDQNIKSIQDAVAFVEMTKPVQTVEAIDNTKTKK
jgi:hypothetical protein